MFIEGEDADKGRVAMIEEGLNASEARGWPPMWITDRARHSLSRMVMVLVLFTFRKTGVDTTNV